MDVSLTIQDHPILIIEGKDEGKGGGDSYFQSIAYYHKEITEETRKFNAPCFLMELVGPRMGISSACALSRVVNVDPLSIHYLLFQPANKSYFLEVAKTFKALRHQLQCLSDLYTVQPMLPQPEYPFFKILKDGHTLTYEEKIQINVIRCVLSNTEDNTHINVIVKFVQGEYGADAHACM